MKKTSNIILAVITAASLIVSIVSDNSEIWNIPAEWITIASSIILAFKQFIEQSGLFTAQEVAAFSNELKENQVYTRGPEVTAKDVKNWKSNQ